MKNHCLRKILNLCLKDMSQTLSTKGLKQTLFLFLGLQTFVFSSTFASNIDDKNIVGFYDIEAKVANKSYMLNAEFLEQNQMVLTLPDDKRNSLCTGLFNMNFESVQDPVGDFIYALVIRSDLTCSRDKLDSPNNEKEEHPADLTLVLKEYTARALNKGTWITVTSSLAKGIELPAKMKKRD